MRFLHSKTLEFHEFPNHKEIEYAILSHTWGDEEILFQDISGFTIPTTPPTIKQKSGYKKIEACCAQADSDGFEYVWIDTCCIDKRSSAELSEAINSMYQWYRDCIVCYAYLTDVTNDLEAEAQRDKFKASRWFTRGWTLQELIAPHVLEFYGNQWYTQGQKASLGTKLSLRNEISDITDIPLPVLKNAQDLNRRSIAQKMSWAASRITTRIEDRAYCLMGLFDVHMPLLYGEGDRSFVRLQEEIMNISDDETIFAWMPNEEDGYIQGLIANSPAYFKNSGNMLTDRKEGSQRTTPITVTSFGLGLELFLPETLRILDAVGPEHEFRADHFEPIIYVAVLNCRTYSSRSLIGLFLICTHAMNGLDMRANSFVRLNWTNIPGSPRGLALINSDTYRRQEMDRTSIFAKLVTKSESSSKSIDFWRTGENKKVWIRACPKGFFVADIWERDAWCSVLLFEDDAGSDAFVATATFDEFSTRGGKFSLRRWTPGNALETHYKTRHSFGKLEEDHATLHLDSGRIICASYRVQKMDGVLGYGLYIYLGEAADTSGRAYY